MHSCCCFQSYYSGRRKSFGSRNFFRHPSVLVLTARGRPAKRRWRPGSTIRLQLRLRWRVKKKRTCSWPWKHNNFSTASEFMSEGPGSPPPLLHPRRTQNYPLTPRSVYRPAPLIFLRNSSFLSLPLSQRRREPGDDPAGTSHWDQNSSQQGIRSLEPGKAAKLPGKTLNSDTRTTSSVAKRMTAKWDHCLIYIIGHAQCHWTQGHSTAEWEKKLERLARVMFSEPQMDILWE